LGEGRNGTGGGGMNKIIIENRTDMPMEDTLFFVKVAMRGGRVSETSKGKQYCFATVWPDGTAVYADRNKKSDKFIVCKR
jgi:hypothetical protein